MKRDEMLSRSFGNAEVIAYALVGVVLVGGALVLIGQSVYEFVERSMTVSSPRRADYSTRCY